MRSPILSKVTTAPRRTATGSRLRATENALQPLADGRHMNRSLTHCVTAHNLRSSRTVLRFQSSVMGSRFVRHRGVGPYAGTPHQPITENWSPNTENGPSGAEGLRRWSRPSGAEV